MNAPFHHAPAKDDLRSRHERQVARYQTTFGHQIRDALITVIHRNGGLSWFTAEQIADLRAELIGFEWQRHQIKRRNRRRRAA